MRARGVACGALLAGAGNGVLPAAVTVDIDSVDHKIDPLSMGCHSDSGYAHQAKKTAATLFGCGCLS